MKPSIFESLYIALGRRLSQGLYDEMLKTQTLTPAWTISKVLALILALIVHLSTLGIGVLGLWAIVTNLGNLFVWLYGLVFIAIAFILRPRLSKIDKEALPRARLLKLYAFVDRIAQALNTSSVEGIVINSDFNALFSEQGWRRRKVMYLGLPLFAVTSPQERVALIAHEMAHGINGDPNRGLLVNSAVRTLAEWYRILFPRKIWAMGRGGFLTGVSMTLANLVTWLLSFIPFGGAYVLAHLIWRNSQRAEYLADYLAAKVSGTDACISLLAKMKMQNNFLQILHTITLNDTKQNLFSELRNQTIEPDLATVGAIDEATLSKDKPDTTHPPDPYRIGFLRAHPITAAKVVLSQDESEQLDAELTQFEQEIQEKLKDKYLSRLYH